MAKKNNNRARRLATGVVVAGCVCAPAASAVERVDIVEPQGHDGVYQPGEFIEIDVTFAEAVDFVGADRPVFQLRIGEDVRDMRFEFGERTETLTFAYEVVDGDLDTDGVSYAADAMVGGTIVNVEDGAQADRSFPALARAAGHSVDGVAPRITAVHVLSTPNRQGAYAAGEAITVRVRFDEAVSAAHSDASLALELDFDGARRTADVDAASLGTDELLFNYAVALGDADGDGFAVAASRLAVGDDLGNSATRRSLRLETRQKVDGVAPAVDRTTIVSDAGDDRTYGLGDGIDIEVAFSEPVRAADSTFTLLLGGSGRGIERPALYVSGDLSERVLYRYEVQPGDRDADGISYAADALTGVSDLLGNALPEDAVVAVPEQTDHRVDGGGDNTGPQIVGLDVVSEPERADTYAAGQTIELEVTFDENVDANGVVLTIDVGGNARDAVLGPTDGGPSLTFRYDVAAGDEDADGISVRPLAESLARGTIQDSAGNPALRDYPGLGPLAVHRVDASAPMLTALRVVSDAGPDETYSRGDRIDIALDFSEPVAVAHRPGLALRLALDTPGVVELGWRDAVLVDGADTASLVFRYEVRRGDHDPDGIAVPYDGLVEQVFGNVVHSGSVTDVAGNPANEPTVEGDPLPVQPAHKVDARTTTPATIAVVSDPGDDGLYGAGDSIRLRVTYDEEIRVVEPPRLRLRLSVCGEEGFRDVLAELVDTTSNTLTFSYRFGSLDFDDDGVSAPPDALVDGEVVDIYGNPANLTGDLDVQANHRVDACQARVAGVEVVSDPGPDGTYGAGDVIEIRVTYNEVVHVSKPPSALFYIVLSVGEHSRPAAFVSGSGTPELLFRYTVAAEDVDTDGISIAAQDFYCEPEGGLCEVQDAAGNLSDREVPSLPAQGDHRVGLPRAVAAAPLELEVGTTETLDLGEVLDATGLSYGGVFVAQSDRADVAAPHVSGNLLTIDAVAEGTAVVVAVAQTAPVAVHVAVTVRPSAAETAVLGNALAALGRGLLSGAAGAIGGRLEAARTARASATGGMPAGAGWTNRAVAPRAGMFGGLRGAAVLGGGRPMDAGHGWGADPRHALAPGSGLAGPAAFSIPMGSWAGPARSWGVWGGADVQFFDGSSDAGGFDGSLRTVQVGLDATGDGWVAGASLARSLAEVAYDFAGAVDGRGTMDAELSAVYPYVQWHVDDRAEVWVLAGFGTGDVKARRDGAAPMSRPADLSMRMAMAGVRLEIGDLEGYDLAARADAGLAWLETGDGIRAVHGLSANVERLRLGVEASRQYATGPGTLTPFVDLGARIDGGAGDTGAGMELIGGVRYRTPTLGVEAKARTLVVHGAGDYSESGLSATVFIEPPEGEDGLRLSLTPGRGTVDARDLFRRRGHAWARGSGSPLREDDRRHMDGRASYRVGVDRYRGFVTTFAEMNLAEVGDRAATGVTFDRQGGLPLRLEMRIERQSDLGGRNAYGILLGAQATY